MEAELVGRNNLKCTLELKVVLCRANPVSALSCPIREIRLLRY